MTHASSPEDSRLEAERQLAAAADRHREAVAAARVLGRSEASQYVAGKSVGRAVHLVSYALRRAAQADVPVERMVELTGWEPDVVREGLERIPEPVVVAQVVPEGVDPHAVVQAAAAFEAVSRLRELTQRVLADVDLDRDVAVEAPPRLAPEDVQQLHTALETAWRTWRQDLGA